MSKKKQDELTMLGLEEVVDENIMPVLEMADYDVEVLDYQFREMSRKFLDALDLEELEDEKISLFNLLVVAFIIGGRIKSVEIEYNAKLIKDKKVTIN